LEYPGKGKGCTFGGKGGLNENLEPANYSDRERGKGLSLALRHPVSVREGKLGKVQGKGGSKRRTVHSHLQLLWQEMEGPRGL